MHPHHKLTTFAIQFGDPARLEVLDMGIFLGEIDLVAILHQFIN